MRIIRLILLLVLISGCQDLVIRTETVERSVLPAIENKFALKQVFSLSGLGDPKATKQIAYSADKLYLVANDTMTAVSLQGAILWQQKLPQQAVAGVVANSKLALAIFDTGRIIAFSSSTGTILWQQELLSEILALPTIDDKFAYIHSMDGAVTKLSLVDGAQLFQYLSPSPTVALRRSGAPLLDGDSLIVGFANGRVKSIDKSDGKVKWEQDLNQNQIKTLGDVTGIYVAPVKFASSVAVATYTGKLYALNANDGAESWSLKLSTLLPITVSERNLFITDIKNDIWSITASGAIAWQQQLLRGRGLTSPCHLKGKLVLADEDGYLSWLDIKTGDILARHKVAKQKIVALKVIKDTLLVLAKDGTLQAYREG